MPVAKPTLVETDIWANTAAPADKVKPNQLQIDEGWTFGQKPPHTDFNWYQETVAQMLVHINENGIPAWDTATEYQLGALAMDSGVIYQALTDNTGASPSLSPTDWEEYSQAIAGTSVVSEPDGGIGNAITNMYSLTQLEYDAIVTPDPTTFYVIVN